MKATVKIEKSFDEGKQFSKNYEPGDFAEFFKEEGDYLDKLSGIMKEHGEGNDKFVVTYTVTLQM